MVALNEDLVSQNKVRINTLSLQKHLQSNIYSIPVAVYSNECAFTFFSFLLMNYFIKC